MHGKVENCIPNLNEKTRREEAIWKIEPYTE
jgi:hypothetical protein